MSKPQADRIVELKERIIQGERITRDEALGLSATQDREALYCAADQIRAHFRGAFIHTCSIINAQSGRCSEDCRWCSQSRHFKTEVPEYGLISASAGVERALENSRQGVDRFSLVTSGRALKPRQVDAACAIYRAIRQHTSIRLCASMGLLRRPELQKLREVGVERYHCNIETAPSNFPKLCTTHTFQDKLRTLREARETGLKVCSGGIFGMGESMAQRIEMAFVLRDQEVDSIPINILNPIPGTPLQDRAPLKDDEILVSLALFRFINPAAQLRLAGGRKLIAPIQEKALSCGICSVLVGDYLTTLGMAFAEDQKMFRRLGRYADALG